MSEVTPEPAPAAPDPDAAQWPVPVSGGFAPPDSDPFRPWPGGASTPAFPPPALGTTQPQPPRPVRRNRGLLIGFVAGAVVVALGLGGYLIAHNRAVSRSNTPVATSSHAKTGGITVTGRGITMTFPAGWVNVPTSPSQFQQFMKAFTDSGRKLPAALKAEVNDPQILNSFAMLVFRQQVQGDFQENLNAAVGPLGPPTSQMLADLESGKGPAQFGATDLHYSVTKFGTYSGVLVTYSLRSQGIAAYGAQAYLNGPVNLVVTTVTSSSAATSEADLRKIVGTLRFS